MKSSRNAIELIKMAEGFKSQPYLCPAKVPTIGYGSTRYADNTPVKMSDKPITVAQAEELLLATLAKEYEPAVNRYVRVVINQNQFDALVSFVYNLGIQALRTSTLLRLVNENKFIAASSEFKKWIWANGKKLPGLIIRRERERLLFLKE